jgi:hypothetical protein
MGAARSTRYALTRGLLGLPARQTITLTTPEGQVQRFGTLCFLQDERLHVQADDGSEWLGEPGQLPWFLEPLRPQGFLGRQFARLRPDFPPDPDDWSTEQVLHLTSAYAIDPPGALQLGDIAAHAVRRVPENPPGAQDRAKHYDASAQGAGLLLPAGSSAGGEQPKFVTETDGKDGRQHLIVKFSPPRGTPFGERWHDLLHLEHLALTVLGESGIPVAKSAVVETADRTYLESQRFDRQGRAGKRHVVAASAVHAACVPGPRRHWIATCEALVARKQLAAQHLQQMASTYLFGQYIGNTDMHFGNLSFFAEPALEPVFVPTPVYDMLPMLWRPGVHGGELVAQPVQPQPQPAGYEAQAAQARVWAIGYWERAAALQSISPQLRAASAACAAQLLHI